MYKAIRPKNRPEQVNCPVCSERYIKNTPVEYEKKLIDIFECSNNHSWKRFPEGEPENDKSFYYSPYVTPEDSLQSEE